MLTYKELKNNENFILLPISNTLDTFSVYGQEGGLDDYCGEVKREKSKIYWKGAEDEYLRITSIEQFQNNIQQFKDYCYNNHIDARSYNNQMNLAYRIPMALSYLAKELNWERTRDKDAFSNAYDTYVVKDSFNNKILEISSIIDYKTNKAYFLILFNDRWTIKSEVFTNYIDAYKWLKNRVSAAILGSATDFMVQAMNPNLSVEKFDDETMQKVVFGANGIHVFEKSFKSQLIEHLKKQIEILESN